MLNKISFVGVDEKTDLDELYKLAELSLVRLEFGVLYSPNRMGKKDHPRYPTLDFMKQFPNQHQTKFDESIHLCGDAVDDFIQRDVENRRLCTLFDRIQLNFSMQKYAESYIVQQLYSNGRDVWSGLIGKMIIQDNKSKTNLVKDILDTLNNKHALYNSVDILFDASGGFGKEIDNVKPVYDFFYCGYAGGINPTNVIDILKKIDRANCTKDVTYYIDMESGIRTNDWFDLDKCRDIILQVNEYIKNEN